MVKDKAIQLNIQIQKIFLLKVKSRSSLSHFCLLLDSLSFFKEAEVPLLNR